MCFSMSYNTVSNRVISVITYLYLRGQQSSVGVVACSYFFLAYCYFVDLSDVSTL